MKKFRWFWLTLLIVQPIFVYLTRTGLRLPVPVHFGLFGSDAWNGLAGQDLVIAMSISGLLPLLGLILTYWSQNPISTTLPRWQPTPRSALSCWTVNRELVGPGKSLYDGPAFHHHLAPS